MNPATCSECGSTAVQKEYTLHIDADTGDTLPDISWEMLVPTGKTYCPDCPDCPGEPYSQEQA